MPSFHLKGLPRTDYFAMSLFHRIFTVLEPAFFAATGSGTYIYYIHKADTVE